MASRSKRIPEGTSSSTARFGWGCPAYRRRAFGARVSGTQVPARAVGPSDPGAAGQHASLTTRQEVRLVRTFRNHSPIRTSIEFGGDWTRPALEDLRPSHDSSTRSRFKVLMSLLLRVEPLLRLSIGSRQNACWNRKGQFRGRFQAKTSRLAARSAASGAN
jgi:hypothetical protein